MKYAINHPSMFKKSLKPKTEHDDKENISFLEFLDHSCSIECGSVYAAFTLGFFQTIISIWVEILVVLYLLSQKVLLDVIIKFVALAAITKFDDLYAGALYEEKMLKVVGKTLPTEYRRCMGYTNTKE